MKHGYESKGIRLDVFVEDNANTVYDIEMQVRHYPETTLGRRTRYYQSTIDFGALQAGVRYDKLKQSIIIFICPFPLFDKKHHMFTFQNICQQDASILLDDGTSKIFLCSKGTLDDVPPEIKNFLDFVDGLPVQDAFVDEIKDLIVELKHTEKEKVDYMTFQMRIDEERDEAREEGRKEGHKEGLQEGRKEGHKEGLQEGRKEGENSLSRLMSILLKDGKTDEAMAATESEEIRKQLYKKYGIA